MPSRGNHHLRQMDSTPATRLRDLGMDEESGVDVPANDGIGGWMVLKSASQNLSFEELEKGADPSTLTAVLEGIRSAHDQLATAIASSTVDAPEMSNPYRPDHKTDQPMKGDQEKKPMQKSFDEALPEEVIAYIEELEAGLDVLADDLVTAQKELSDAITKAVGPEDDEEEIDVTKSMSEDVRKAFDQMAEENETLRKAVEVERTVRLDAEATEKAARWETLTLKADEFGPALRRVADIDVELAEQIERALDAANTAVSTTKAFDEFGSASKGNPSSGAWGEIESLAKSKSDSLGISFAEAVTVVANERPDLYQRHQNREV